MSETGSSIDRRDGARVPYHGVVTVRVDGQTLEGTGQNVSKTGLSMIANAPIRVLVQVEGEDEPREAELVRANPNPGGTGIAVRFLEPRSLDD